MRNKASLDVERYLLAIVVARRRQLTFFFRPPLHSLAMTHVLTAADGTMCVASDSANSTTEFAVEPGPYSHSGVVSSVVTLLFVDDDEDSAESFMRYFQPPGYRVLLAKNAAEASLAVTTESVDAVLLDVSLPDEKGTTLLRRWRSERSLRDLPILMTTALDKPEDMVAAFNAGANDYVVKPYDFGVLAARIAVHLRAKEKLDWERFVQGRLSRAQIEVSHRFGGAMHGENLALWQAELVRAFESIFSDRAVGAWNLSHDDNLVLQEGVAPATVLGALQRRTVSRTMTPLLQQSAIWLPITDGASVVTLLSLELLPGDDVELLVRLTSTFASQLSAQLQVTATSSKSSLPLPQDATGSSIAICPICLTCYDPASTDRCSADGSELRKDFPGVTHVVGGRYCLERLVGEGGMGAVFRAYDAKLSRHVAIKVLHGGLASRGEFRNRFLAEATLCGRLRHPHLVNVYDFCETEEGALFIVMEWVNGKDMGYFLRRLGAASPGQVAAMVRQCGEALDCTHRAGIIHRDVKPSNIMLVHSDAIDVRLADFGVARRLTPGVSRTLPGLIVGTPKYLAPEQAYGGRIGPGTDLYALAVVTAEMLLGPHVNRRARGAVDLSQPPISMTHPLFAEASPRLVELFEAAWKPDLKDRPPQVLDWATALGEEISKLERHEGPGWALAEEAG